MLWPSGGGFVALVRRFDLDGVGDADEIGLLHLVRSTAVHRAPVTNGNFLGADTVPRHGKRHASQEQQRAQLQFHSHRFLHCISTSNSPFANAGHHRMPLACMTGPTAILRTIHRFPIDRRQISPTSKANHCMPIGYAGNKITKCGVSTLMSESCRQNVVRAVVTTHTDVCLLTRPSTMNYSAASSKGLESENGRETIAIEDSDPAGAPGHHPDGRLRRRWPRDVWLLGAGIRERIWHNLLDRTTGPMIFRFILQPIMATIAALRDGVEDARTGRSPYFWTILSDESRRSGAACTRD